MWKLDFAFEESRVHFCGKMWNFLVLWPPRYNLSLKYQLLEGL